MFGKIRHIDWMFNGDKFYSEESMVQEESNWRCTIPPLSYVNPYELRPII